MLHGNCDVTLTGLQLYSFSWSYDVNVCLNLTLQRAWENKTKDKKTALSKLYAAYKPLRERELKTEEAGKDRVGAIEYKSKRKDLRSSQSQSALQELH